MSKRLIVVLALLFVVGLTFTAYAEVQNVKVSGDIVASGVARNHFNLSSTAVANGNDKSQIKDTFLMSQIRLRVDADLTDNVIATVRLINERKWNGANDTSASGNDKIGLDLGYVTLKEFLYSPLSLTIGRQEIEFGNGLIMGNAKLIGGATNIPTDLTERKSFDAIRATLNYDPLVVDLVYAKIKQQLYDANNNPDRKNIDLLGVNANYALTKKTNVSGYYFLKRDNFKGDTTGASTNARGKADIVNTVGALITSSPIDNLAASLEGAYQWGRNDMNNATQNQHRAWAMQAMADYTFANVKTTPKVGASYTYLSGDRNAVQKDNHGWDQMFYDQKLNNIVYAIMPFTNMQVVNLKASCKPMNDITLSAVYGWYNVAQKPTAGTAVANSQYYDGGTTAYSANQTYTGKKHLGDALDLTATYDYTEDVQFALTGGWFKPGEGLTLKDKDATQLIGSMKVTF